MNTRLGLALGASRNPNSAHLCTIRGMRNQSNPRDTKLVQMKWVRRLGWRCSHARIHEGKTRGKNQREKPEKKTRAQKQQPPLLGGGVAGWMGRKIESQAQRREPAALEVIDGTTSFAKNIRYQIPFLLNLSSVIAFSQ